MSIAAELDRIKNTDIPALMSAITTKGGTLGAAGKDIQDCTAGVNSIPAGGQTIPTAGLTAYYPLTENANDLSGNGRHGTASSGVTFSGTAAKLTAYPQYIDIPTDAVPASLFTVSMWATSVFNYQRYPMIFLLGAEGANTAIGLGYHADGYSSILCSTWGTEVLEFSDEADPLFPHHYLITYDGSASALALYVDGVYRGTLNVAVDIGTLRRIGQANDAAMQSMYQWTGAFWAFRAYDRVLTQTEITALAQEY